MVRNRLQAIRSDSAPVGDLTRRIELREEIVSLRRALDAALSLYEVPIELCHTLRAPAGETHVVELLSSGQPVRAVISPLGRVDPEREIAIWRDLLDAAASCTRPGEELRRMDSALLAVRVAETTLVVNAVHSRATVRAAIKLLRSGAFVPLPLVWLWQQARKRPGRAAVAVAGVVTAVGLALASAHQSAAVEAVDRPTAPAQPFSSEPPPEATRSPTPSPAPSTPPRKPLAFEPAPLPSMDTEPADDDGDPRRPDEQPDDDESNEPRSPDIEDGPDGSEPPTPELARTSPPPRDAPSGTDQPTRDSTPSRSPSPAPTQAPAEEPAEEPATTPPSPAAASQCSLINVDVDLPVLNVNLCL